MKFWWILSYVPTKKVKIDIVLKVARPTDQEPQEDKKYDGKKRKV